MALRVRTPAEAFEAPTPTGSAADAGDVSRRTYAVLVASALAVAFMVRASFIFASPFPLNDGGLFFVMARDIEAARFGLPARTSYNGGGIPFAYPPLALYLAAALERFTPLSLVDALRFVPLVASTSSVGAFFLLARRLLRRREAVAFATFAMALLPATGTWMIMGGGLTRSVGYTFALLAMHEAHAMYTERKRRRAVSFGVLAALTTLSHPEMPVVLAVSTATFFAFEGRNRAGVRSSLLGGAVAAALLAPWLAAVTAAHGLAPFLAARASGGASLLYSIGFLARLDFTSPPMFDFIGALALLGVLACLARREYMLLAWIVAMCFLDPRSVRLGSAAPIALLSAIGLFGAVAPLLRSAETSFADAGFGRRLRAARAPAGWLLPAFTAVAIAYSGVASLSYGTRLLSGMTPDEQSAMAWVAKNTPPDARFVVVTDDGWARDRTSEWFPALTGRRSVATVQGSEWVTGAYGPMIDQYVDLQACSRGDSACLAAWSATHGAPYDYVYIPAIPARIRELDQGPCCAALRASLASDPAYERVYDGAGAVVYRRTLPASAP
ncbi:MAG TPA: glycosyltransferase family 39 protein [Dehalococcoidia bacterium]|nr:glycosyltransferase family 39 protein [Dehalococcoidia bacterium]